jgi:hypothetical protein
MTRVLYPELLDSLPSDDPDALRSRRDLRIINRLMGTHAWIERTLPSLLRPGECALEVGAGTGELARRLGERGVPVDGLDRCPASRDWPRARAWHTADLRTFDGYRAYPVVFGNLILHHLTDGELASLGAKLGHAARIVLFAEPTRSRLSQRMFALFSPCFGANQVTRHDAHVSIAAGFLGHELPRALGLDPRAWEINCSTTAFGAYRMLAVRRT